MLKPIKPPSKPIKPILKPIDPESPGAFKGSLEFVLTWPSTKHVKEPSDFLFTGPLKLRRSIEVLVGFNMVVVGFN